ncbi:unnamed protein product [Lampetra fluviatilis]
MGALALKNQPAAAAEGTEGGSERQFVFIHGGGGSEGTSRRVGAPVAPALFYLPSETKGIASGADTCDHHEAERNETPHNAHRRGEALSQQCVYRGLHVRGPLQMQRQERRGMKANIQTAATVRPQGCSCHRACTLLCPRVVTRHKLSRRLT